MMSHKKARMGRSRDFGTEGAGKGDADRTTDAKAFGNNYDLIDWGRKPKQDPAPFQPLPPAGFTPPTTDLIRE